MKFKTLKKYYRVWLRQSKLAFKRQLNTKISAVLFIFGKTFRFFMYLLFLFFLVKNTQTLAGYTLNQVIFIYLTFNLVDVISQFFLRGAYVFRPLIERGQFDLYLPQPLNPLFRALTRETDALDLLTLLPLITYTIYFSLTNHLLYSPLSLLAYLLLIFNALLISLSFHIIVLSLGIIAVRADNVLMLYRDLTNMARFPIDIYRSPIKELLTFILPIAVMFLFPARAFFAPLNWLTFLISLLIGPISLFLTLALWRFSLKKYSSASS